MKNTIFTIVFCLSTLPVCVFGIDNDFNSKLMNATFKIQGTGSSGTGFVIVEPFRDDPSRGIPVLVTANHVFESIKSDGCLVLLRTRNGTEFEKLIVPLQIRDHDKPLWVRHPKVDIAAIRIQIPTNACLEGISTKMLASETDLKEIEIHPGDEVMALGYPYGLESNSAGFPVLRSGKIASYPLTPIDVNKTFMVDLAVFGGNSGGPVYYEYYDRAYGHAMNVGTRHAKIIGIVVEQVMVNEPVKTMDDEGIRNHRLSIAVVVHAKYIHDVVHIVAP
jgi:S1-C subfamily serine protease